MCGQLLEKSWKVSGRAREVMNWNMIKEEYNMLYIMRHGRTDWNVRHKLQGRTDIPLNDEGRMMAAEAGKRYADIHFDICYSSPLERAKETAEIFLKGRNVPVYTDDRLVEMGFGVYEGIENSFAIDDCPINTLLRSLISMLQLKVGKALRSFLQEQESL